MTQLGLFQKAITGEAKQYSIEIEHQSYGCSQPTFPVDESVTFIEGASLTEADIKL